MSRAQHVPNIVLKPPDVPTVTVFLVAIAVSGPGKMMRRMHMMMNR
jgi:hypothetical protein